MIVRVFVLVSMLFAPISAAAQSIVQVPTHPDVGDLGLGYDSTLGSYIYKCLNPQDDVLLAPRPGNRNGYIPSAVSHINESYQQVVSNSVGSQGGSAAYKGFGISGAKDFNESTSVTSFATTAHIVINIESQDVDRYISKPTLKPEYLKMLGSADGYVAFRNQCGDKFLKVRRYGGRFEAYFSFTSTSRSNQSSLLRDVAIAFKSKGESLEYGEAQRSAEARLSKVSQMDCAIIVVSPVPRLPDCNISSILSFASGFQKVIEEKGAARLTALDELGMYSSLLDKQPNGWLEGLEIYERDLKPLHELYVALRRYRADVNYASRSDPGEFRSVSRGYLDAFNASIDKRLNEVEALAERCLASIRAFGDGRGCHQTSLIIKDTDIDEITAPPRLGATVVDKEIQPYAITRYDAHWLPIPDKVVHPRCTAVGPPCNGIMARPCDAFVAVATNAAIFNKILRIKGNFRYHDWETAPQLGSTRVRVVGPGGAIYSDSVPTEESFILIPSGHTVEMITADCRGSDWTDNNSGTGSFELGAALFPNDFGTGDSYGPTRPNDSLALLNDGAQ